MEGITTFEFHLDIDSCHYLYDYLKCKRLDWPKEGWDFGVIARATEKRAYTGPIPEFNIESYVALHEAHRDKGVFEKAYLKAPSQGTSMSSSMLGAESLIVLQPWVLPVFQPGDLIKGHVTLHLDQPLKAESINLEFHGGAHTRVRVHTGKGYYDAQGHEIYANENARLWLRNGVFKTATVGTLPMATEDMIQSGRHKFPFEFTMPRDARPSVPPFNKGADFAYISYILRATIEKGNMLKRGNVVIHQSLWVDRPMDIGQNLQNLEPIRVEETYDTGCLSCCFGSSKSITCRAGLPQKAFIKGEKVPLSLEVDNCSGSIISNVGSSVEIVCIYKAKSCCQHTRTLQKCGVLSNTGKIASNTSPSFQKELQVNEFPGSWLSTRVDGMLLPPVPLLDCGIITLEYRVKIEIKKKGTCCKTRLHIPIAMGTRDSSQLANNESQYRGLPQGITAGSSAWS